MNTVASNFELLLKVVERKIAEVNTRLDELENKKQQLDERLSFLLKGGAEMAESFRDEYQRGLLSLRNEERELAGRRKQIAAAQVPSKNGGLEQIREALGYLNNKDMVSLKSIYKRLFHKIIVRPLDAVKVELEFVLNKATSSIRNGEVAFCTAAGVTSGKELP